MPLYLVSVVYYQVPLVERPFSLITIERLQVVIINLLDFHGFKAELSGIGVSFGGNMENS